MKYTLTLPHLPPKELSPNRKLHWAVKSPATRTAREETGWIAKSEYKGETMQKVRVNYLFRTKSRICRDCDTLIRCCKPIIDGLVDAKVFKDDNWECMEIGSARVVLDDREETVITVESI